MSRACHIFVVNQVEVNNTILANFFLSPFKGLNDPRIITMSFNLAYSSEKITTFMSVIAMQIPADMSADVYLNDMVWNDYWMLHQAERK